MSDQVQSLASSQFPSTSWGLVLAAGVGSGGGAAFAELCRRYWRPIYASLRRQGFVSAEAEDLTQGFFLRLIEDHTVARAEPERGRFRSFLLGALRRFLSDDRERASALKCGGHGTCVATHIAQIESSLQFGAEAQVPLALQFDRQWARALVRNALDVLRVGHVETGQVEICAALRKMERGRR